MTAGAAGGAGLEELTRHRHILVCCGAGGVGKTTIAAVAALQGARMGRKTVVVTIDPARRLADALGLGGITDRPTRIPGDRAGELWATMLDTKSTFDALVLNYASTPEQGERILTNRFYRNLSEALSGTQEYMAMEKLYELHEESDFDLIVVDTPPTRHALDFLDAPRRLSSLLDSRLFRSVVLPRRGIVRAVNLAAQTFLRTVAKVVGSEVIEDAIAFFRAFEGMEEGFRRRSEHVNRLLRARETAFVLVASPRRDSVDEAHYFAERLAEGGITVECLVVNRVHPDFGDGLVEATRARAETLVGSSLGRLYGNLADFQMIASREREHLVGLAEAVTPAPVVWVPVLQSDVHDLDGMAKIASHLYE